jgi:hypothetical protein
MLPKCRNKQLIFKNRVVQVVLLIFIHRKMVELRAGYPTSKTFTYMIYHHTNVITKSLLTAQNVCKSKLCSTGEGRSDMQQFDLLVDHGDVGTELRLRVCSLHLGCQNICKSKLCSTREGSSDMQQFDLLVNHGDVRTELRLRVCTWAGREGRGPRGTWSLTYRTPAPVYKQNREKIQGEACP